MTRYGVTTRLDRTAGLLGAMTDMGQSSQSPTGSGDLARRDFVYLWVNGIHVKVRLEQEAPCLLVMTGVCVPVAARGWSRSPAHPKS